MLVLNHTAIRICVLAACVLFTSAAARAGSADIVLQPGDSIETAIGQMQGPGQIVLSPGVYTESFKIQGRSDEIIIRSAAPGAAIIEPLPGKQIFRIMNNSGLLIFDGVVFRGAETVREIGGDNLGGAGFIEHSVVEFHDCEFRDNSCATIGQAGQGAGSARGGALYASNSTVRLFGSRFVDNAAIANAPLMLMWSYRASGGAVCAKDSDLLIFECDFISNAARLNYDAGESTGSAAGGAISAERGYTVIYRCRVFDNQSIVHASNLSAENLQGAYGAGVHFLDVAPDSALILGSLITGNTAAISISQLQAGGAGVWAENSRPQIQFCTITDNSAPKGGAGVGFRRSDGQPGGFMGNCIVSGNIGAADTSGAFISTGFNLIGDPGAATITGDQATNLIGVDPMFVDAAARDFRLAPGSPCIDRADSRIAIDYQLFQDLDGEHRGVDDPASPDTGFAVMTLLGLAAVDIGAYEFQPPAAPTSACPADLTGDGQVGSADLAQVLASWGVCP